MIETVWSFINWVFSLLVQLTATFGLNEFQTKIGLIAVFLILFFWWLKWVDIGNIFFPLFRWFCILVLILVLVLILLGVIT